MNYIKFAKWTYFVLAILDALGVGISFFVECNHITQISLLIQAVGFGFVSGVYFGM